MRKRPTIDESNLWAELHAFLGRWRTATLATTDDQGSPHAADVWYAHEPQLRLVFLSSPDSAHVRHLRARPRAAVSVHAETADPLRIHGVQMRGRCAVLDAPPGMGGTEAEDAAWRLYTKKYPFVEHEAFRGLLALQRFVRFVPDWARWIDNRRGFGFKIEMELEIEPPRGSIDGPESNNSLPSRRCT